MFHKDLFLKLCGFVQVWCGLSDSGVECWHDGPGLQRDAPPLHLPVGPAAVQLRRSSSHAAAHLPLPRLHEGPGGAVQGLPIAAARTILTPGRGVDWVVAGWWVCILRDINTLQDSTAVITALCVFIIFIVFPSCWMWGHLSMCHIQLWGINCVGHQVALQHLEYLNQHRLEWGEPWSTLHISDCLFVSLLRAALQAARPIQTVPAPCPAPLRPWSIWNSLFFR